jgi:hypothetical protein
MKITHLLSLLLFIISICCTSACNKKTSNNILTKNGLAINGGQEVPAKLVAGSGTIDLSYNKDTRTLSYKVTWSGLTGNLIAFHIHGAGKKGFNAGIIQSFSGFTNTPQGTYNGSVFIDGVVFKETELLNGEYYVNLHTLANSGGEIRGQIEF